jgi:hypothetical protein
MVDEVSVFMCGGVGCPKGGDHEWDGPGKVFISPCRCTDGELEPDPSCTYCGGSGEVETGDSATCSKCGLDAMSHDLWNAP